MIPTGNQAAIRAPGPSLLDGKVQRGFNVHHPTTVFVQRVDLGELAELQTTDAGPGFAAGFIERFDSLDPELVAELEDAAGVPFDRALLGAILAIEGSAARAMGRLDTPEFSKIVRDPLSPREVELVWECQSGTVARAAARAALAGIVDLLPASLLGLRAKPEGRFATLVRNLEKRCRRRQWSPTTAALVLAARKRGIPCEPLAGDYLRVGDGVLQHVVSASATPDLEHVVPTGAFASIPVALILGTRGARSLAGDLDGLLRASGRSIGLATRKVTTISGQPVDPTSFGRGDGARFLLGDPRMEMVISAVTPARVEERGLRLDRATVTAILDSETGDARGIDVGVAATTGFLVVGSDNPVAERLARELGHERLVLLSGPPGDAVTAHLAAGGSAVVRTSTGRADTIELRRANETIAAVPVASLRSKGIGVGERRIRRAMFATALAFGLGLSGGEIVAAAEKRRFLRR